MKIKRILVTITLFFVIMSTVPAVSAATVEDLCNDMLNYYYHHRGDGLADIERLLQEMEDLDPDEAAQWRALMGSWYQANTQIDFSDSTLPEGLPEDDSLCIVVMGYQLGSEGSMQDELLCRLEIALTAAQQYPNAYILVTGGATGSGSTDTEAAKMANWLISKDISPDRIIQETKAFSTEENAINCIKLLKSDYPQIRHLALVTSDYHMLRTHLVFAARQAAVGGDIIDIVGHACYDTPTGTGMSYAHQAELIAMMTGVTFRIEEAPALSTVTELTLSGEAAIEAGSKHAIQATAKYDTGFSRDVTADTVFTGFDSHTLGKQTIQASFTDGDTTVTAAMDVEVMPAQTEATDPQDAPASAQIAKSEEASVPEKDGMFKWLVAIAVVLVIILLIILYELRQQYLRAQRKKRRKRQRLILE